MKLAVAIMLACAATAAADPSSKQRADATAAYQEGQRRYLDEDYAGAAVQFETAYRLDPDPAYEFNIAQAYRLAKDCTKALDWYRKFLVDAPKAPNRDAVKKYIADLEGSCKPSEPAPSPAVPAPTAEPQNAGAPAVEQRDELRPSHLRRNLGFGALALGAAGVVTGAVFTSKVFKYSREREDLCNGCEWTDSYTVRAAKLEDLGHRAQRLEIVGYAVGAAAIGAGVWLILSGPHAHESSVAIVPTHDGAFVSVSLRR